jgi:hypothetical protein
MRATAEDGANLYVLHLRPARQRARRAAAAEVCSLLRDLGAVLAPGGPLAERPAVLWVTVPDAGADAAVARFPRLGYTNAVDVVEPAAGGARGRRASDLVRWRGGWWRLRPVYREEEHESTALEGRTFRLEVAPGRFREVRGYRGDSSPTGRRGLPYYDARLLANLVFAPGRGRLLDPFAGAAGVIVEAAAGGWRTFASDRDPALRLGLAGAGAQSCIADAAALPFADACMRALASEPPYDESTRAWLPRALAEAVRVLEPGGRLALLVAHWQSDLLAPAAAALPLRLLLREPIDRKGLPVAVLAWERTP